MLVTWLVAASNGKKKNDWWWRMDIQIETHIKKGKPSVKRVPFLIGTPVIIYPCINECKAWERVNGRKPENSLSTCGHAHTYNQESASA